MISFELVLIRLNMQHFQRRKINRVQMKRKKNVRKMKAIARAVAKTEKKTTKLLKKESKTLRIQSAKKLYD